MKASSKVNKTWMTPAGLARLAGASAVVAGLGTVVIGVLHPVNEAAYVTTPAWIIAHIAAMVMCFFGLFGLAGLYARQAHRAGWLGLIGFVLYSLWLGLVLPFSFVEAFILPILASESPAFVEGFMGIFTGAPSAIDFGILLLLWNISGPLVILGPLLFGIATFRAGILSRPAAVLLALGSLMAPVGALVPPELQPKLIMIPLGIGLAWLGYSLFAGRQAVSPQAALELGKVA